jgi:biopolymer transport protein ExbD
MTVIAPQPTAISRRQSPVPKIDMTPMVDLGFLLITFFIFTTTLSEPGITKLIVPKEGDSTAVARCNALTLLLDNEKVYAYEGLLEEALRQNRIMATDYNLQTGMGNSIRQKQKSLPAKEDLVVLIKPLATSLYQNVIAALDEMTLNGVKKYAFVNASEEEKAILQNH